MTIYKNPFVVAIEDEPNVLEAMKLFLESEGFDVLATSSVENAITRLVELGRTPDLIISDYRLAGSMVGTDAIRILQVNADTLIPGILLTADTSPYRIQEAQARGIRILHKPLRTEILRTVINQVLKQAHSFAASNS